MSKEEKRECEVCCEKFNRSNRKEIECKGCEGEYGICRECTKRYISEGKGEIKCMKCKREWEIEEQEKNFEKKYINEEIKRVRERYLLEREISKCPETQIYAEREKLKRGIEKQREIIIKEKLEMEKEIMRKNKKIRECNEMINEIMNEEGMKERNKRVITVKCPMSECNGFLDEKYMCGICDKKICKECMEEKEEEEEHKCNEEKVETVKMLRKDSRGCPQCGEYIYKIDGCDQMYCIRCHTGFSWRTGKIERGEVHNPEYYRWMRENGRVIVRREGDEMNVCGNEIVNFNVLLIKMREMYPLKENERGRILENMKVIKITGMHRMEVHLRMLNEIYINNERMEERELRELRIKYILNEIEKKEYMKILQMKDKKKNKEKRINDINEILRIEMIEKIGCLLYTSPSPRD